MILGLCTIQRDRAPWIVEWLAFHYIVGFRKFYFYAHHCTDETSQIIAKLSSVLDIKAFQIPDLMDFVQLKAYQHAYDNFGHEVDWMAFIDGDEFLFPTADDDLCNVLQDYSYKRMSALAAYWVCYGSSGHTSEPKGLVIENYMRRPPLSFLRNRHVKSIVMGRQEMTAAANSHLFKTQFGTYDELMRPITHGFMKETEPSYTKLRINHYICQSRDYYMGFKNKSGMADAGHAVMRPDDWWSYHDQNDESDGAIFKFRDRLATMVAELNEMLLVKA
jgi:hypothetical protein